MNHFLRNRLPNSAAIIVLAALLFPAMANAQTTLTSAQLSQLQSSLNGAIQSAGSNSAARQSAISQSLQSAIAQYGADAAGSITSAILAIAEQAGVTRNDIGSGLAQGAAAIAATNSAAANAIAQTLANEGNSDEVVAFQSSTTALGYTNLASIAGASHFQTNGHNGPAGALGRGFGVGGGGGFTGGGTGGGGGGCLNPSCTSLFAPTRI